MEIINGSVILKDNVECMKILSDHGLLGTMQPSGAFTASHAAFRHTHEGVDYYCLAAYHCGHREEKDNGFTICMLPCKSWTKEEAQEFFKELIRGTTSGACLFQTVNVGRNEDN